MKGLLVFSTAASSLVLALAFTLGGAYLLALVSLLLGALWLLGRWRGWPLGAPSFALLLLLAGLGLLGFAPAALLLLGGVTALIAWDLEGFTNRLSSAKLVKDEAALQQSHLRRLLATAGLGLLLGGAALLLRLELNFFWALLLVALILLGLSRSLPRGGAAGS